MTVTDLEVGTGVQFKPDSITVKIEAAREDVLRCGGKDHPDKTRDGQFTVSVDMTIDREDPATGLSPVDEYNIFFDNHENDQNIMLIWDTGTEADTALNHKLVLDLPKLRVVDPEIVFDPEKSPMQNLTYEGLRDATVKYMVGCMVQNSASLV